MTDRNPELNTEAIPLTTGGPVLAVHPFQNLNNHHALTITMAVCPTCDADITDWANRIEKAPAANTPKVWTCPECDVVLGISDWGTE